MELKELKHPDGRTAKVVPGSRGEKAFMEAGFVAVEHTASKPATPLGGAPAKPPAGTPGSAPAGTTTKTVP